METSVISFSPAEYVLYDLMKGSVQALRKIGNGFGFVCPRRVTSQYCKNDLIHLLIFCYLRDSFLGFITVNQDPWTSLEDLALDMYGKCRRLTPPHYGLVSSCLPTREAQTLCNVILENVDPLGHEIMKHLGRSRISEVPCVVLMRISYCQTST